MEKDILYLNKLKRYKKIHGHCDVPEKSQVDTELSMWVRNIRKRHEQLNAEFKKKLKGLGFKFKSRDQLWEKNYLKLAKFIKANGHSGIPKGHPLYYWLHKQRYFKDQLSGERIRKLEALKIYWDYQQVRDQDWYIRFKELQAYKRRYGNCQVPYNWPNNRKLGSWVHYQRVKYSNKNLNQENIDMLNSLGFAWSTKNGELLKSYHEKHWEKMYKQLVLFHQKFGDCLVSQTSKDFKSLGAWVSKNRQLYKKELLSKDRIAKLKRLGFVWQVPIELRYRKKII